jgi:hypothetical protein
MGMVKMGQAEHMGKWEVHTAMIRLVRDLEQRLEDEGLLHDADHTGIDNIVYEFIAALPKKVHDEVLHG